MISKVPPKFSFLLFGFALLIAIFIIHFVSTYLPFINAQRGNLLTKISFFIVNIIALVFIGVIIFFQQWIYKNIKFFFPFSIFLIGILMIEGFLQIVIKRPLRFYPHPYLNYIGTPYYKSADKLNMHNSQGFRGSEVKVPKPKGRIRIAILGGSTAYEETVKDWRKDFARQLEEELRKGYTTNDIEVINAGLPGWDSWEDLVNLEFRLLDFDLDFIIPYQGVNDVHARFVPPSFYRGDNTGNKAQWERRPCLVLLCLKTVQLITGFEPYNFEISAPTYTRPQTNDYNSILGMSPMEALAKNPPVYFERNLRNMIAVAEEFEIRVILTTWAWSNKFSDLASTPHYQQGFKELNEIVRRLAKDKNLPMYDFASNMSMDKKYWTEGIHNNEAGVDMKAKLFADYIIRNKILGYLKK